MAWKHLGLCILREFTEVQHFVERRVATEEAGLEALRKAWRERQAKRGECRSCRRPADPGSKSCRKHREENAARARAANAKRRAERRVAKLSQESSSKPLALGAQRAMLNLMKTVDVTMVRVIRRTAAALLVQDDCGTEGWVPRSQIEMHEIGSVDGAQFVVTMPAWLASAKGFNARQAA